LINKSSLLLDQFKNKQLSPEEAINGIISLCGGVLNDRSIK